MKKQLRIKIILVVIIFLILLSAKAFSQEMVVEELESIDDIDESKDYIKIAIDNKLVKGKEGGLDLESKISRAELVTLINRTLKLDEVVGIANFIDIPFRAWYYEELEKGVNFGIVTGDGNKIYPEKSITKEEAYTMLGRAFHISNKDFIDNFNYGSKWSKEYLKALYEEKYIDNYDLEELSSHITRGECISIIGRVYDENSGELEVPKKVEIKNNKYKSNQRIPVLMYHHILPRNQISKYGWKNNSCVVSLENFKSQMDYLKNNGYTTITTEELNKFLRGDLRIPKKSILVTFDDGYLSNTHYAYNILKSNNQKAAIFIIGISEKRGYEEMNPGKLQFVNFKDLDKYKDVFEYQCHTYDMHREIGGKTRIGLANESVLIDDLNKNKKLLNTSSIAYPKGVHNDRIIKAVKMVGYDLGFTINSGYVNQGQDPYRLPRQTIYPYTSMNEFISIIK